MKLLGRFFALSLASAGCVGNISSGDGNPGPGPGPGVSVPPGPGDKDPPIDKPPVVVGSCNEGTLAKPRLWRLTHAQLRNSLQDALGFVPPTIATLPPESRLEGFANEADKLSISPLLADFYFKSSDELSAEVLRRGSEFIKCPMAQLGTGTCLNDFIKNVGLKMWRRPLTDTEVGAFAQLQKDTATKAGGPEAGVGTVVQAMFLSPNFIYRTELGNSTTAGAVTYLTDHELASALSYTLWDTGPDATLLDLAGQGKLHTKEALTAQAKRMLETPAKASPAMHHFVQQWLNTESLKTKTKDPTLFSVYTAEVAADLVEESRLYMNSVLFDSGADRSFKTLFTGSYGFVNARTAPLYGASVTGTNLTRTELNPAERRGILTQASFMAAHADPDGTALVDRGRFLREQMLCDIVPPPPGDVAQLDPKFADANMTGREKFEQHSSDPACIGCHKLFDGLGFAMESYDAIGRYRTTDKGKQLDPSGTISTAKGDLTFTNFIDLVDQLSKGKELYSCFSTQYLTYSTGLAQGAVNACEKTLVAADFEKSGYKLDALILSVINSPSFMARKN